MSPTVPFDIPASFLFGAVIALACAPQVRRSGNALLNPYFLGAVLFEVFLFLPFGAYLYYFHTDWSWMYFFDPSQIESRTVKLLGFAALSGYLAALIVGFQLTQYLVRRDRTGAARLAALTVLAGLGLFSLLTSDRLLHIGSYADYAAGSAALLFRHRVGYLNTMVGILMAGSLYFMIRTFRTDPGWSGD